MSAAPTLPLEGVLVVSIEQAVAAPTCTCRLADAGARVIKIERPEGDFARHYDSVVHGESAHFVWLNRGKESVVLDLGKDDDKAVLEALLAKADVFVQNLKPRAVAKLGFAVERLRRDYPRLIVCSISGYGESGPYAHRKAYDLLVQAEVGLASITGGPEAPARVGVSVCDIGSGMNAHAAVLEALLARQRTGHGAAISISLFDSMADWMAIALLLQEGGQPPQRLGLSHTSIAPYGVFSTKEGTDILISIQNDREWRVFAERVLDDPLLAADPEFATVAQRTARRPETDGRVAQVFSATAAEALIAKLEAADIAFALVNDVAGLARHPHLRRISVDTPTGPASYSAPAAIWAGAPRRYGPVPALGQDTEKVRAEFLGGAHPALEGEGRSLSAAKASGVG
jgi:itaconate CoA-transferase